MLKNVSTSIIIIMSLGPKIGTSNKLPLRLSLETPCYRLF
jgi:hypothetical protein